MRQLGASARTQNSPKLTHGAEAKGTQCASTRRYASFTLLACFVDALLVAGNNADFQ
jgi:hypothetical protein